MRICKRIFPVTEDWEFNTIEEFQKWLETTCKRERSGKFHLRTKTGLGDGCNSPGSLWIFRLKGDYMRKHKSSVSEAPSYKEIGEFWDTHDLADFWNKTREASFEVDIESEVTYYAVDKMLSEKIQAIAQKRGVTADTLINLWVQEKLQEQRVS